MLYYKYKIKKSFMERGQIEFESPNDRYRYEAVNDYPIKALSHCNIEANNFFIVNIDNDLITYEDMLAQDNGNGLISIYYFLQTISWSIDYTTGVIKRL